MENENKEPQEKQGINIEKIVGAFLVVAPITTAILTWIIGKPDGSINLGFTVFGILVTGLGAALYFNSEKESN